MRFPARPGSWALAASWMAAAGPAPPAHALKRPTLGIGVRRAGNALIALC